MRCILRNAAANIGDTKTLSGFGGAGVAELEVVKDLRGDTFRAVYTLRYAGSVYVPSCFREEIENREGRRHARDIELVRQRLREAEQMSKREKP